MGPNVDSASLWLEGVCGQVVAYLAGAVLHAVEDQDLTATQLLSYGNELKYLRVVPTVKASKVAEMENFKSEKLKGT